MNTPAPEHYDPGAYLLTVPQALEALHISRSSLYKQFKAGRIKTVRIGSRVLVPRREIERLIDEAVGESA